MLREYLAKSKSFKKEVMPALICGQVIQDMRLIRKAVVTALGAITTAFCFMNLLVFIFWITEFDQDTPSHLKRIQQ